jgi:thiamine biosynthesis protein thiS
MNVTINKKPLALPDNATLSDALQAASIEPKGIAIAVDGTVVRKTDYNSFTLADGSEILAIQAFYGG